MQLIKRNELKSHESNDFFFDDITGDNWTEFLKSIETSGIIEPVIITQNKVIVSGHQRVRACEALGIEEVPCEIRIYESDEKVLKDLLETNLRQRGIGNTNPIKLSRCIVELEKIYGIHNGGNRKSERDNLALKNQAELAEQFGMSPRQLQDYKKLLSLIPELQDAIKDGDLSPTVGYKVLAKLSKEEQEKLISDFGAEYISSLTQKKAQELITDIKQEMEDLEKNKEDLEKDYETLQKDKEQLEEKLEEALDKKKVVDNTDYRTIESLKEQLSQKSKELASLKEDKDLLEQQVKLNEEDAQKYNDLKNQLEFLAQAKDDIERKINSAIELSELVVKIDHVLKTELAPIKYSRSLERMDSEVAVENLKEIIESVESWCIEMRQYLPNSNVIDIEVSRSMGMN